MQPRLALAYSSQAPLQGGIAAGWSLDLPVIDLDPSGGPGNPRYTVNGQRLVSIPEDGALTYVSASGGVTAVTAPFRAELDAGFARYGLVTPSGWTDSAWMAQTPDGITRYFEYTDGIRWYLCLVVGKLVEMGNGVQAIEYRFSEAASEFIVPFFTKVAE
jgi:hypothetical protein